MNEVLEDLALKGAVLVIRDDRGGVSAKVEGDEVRRVVRVLHRLDELAQVAQLRGIPFTRLLESRENDPQGERRLPTHQVVWQDGDALCFGEDQARRVLDEKGLVLDELGAAAAVGSARTGGISTAAPNGAASAAPGRTAQIRTLHENRELERLFAELGRSGISIDDYALVQEEAVTGEKMPTRYGWLVEQEKGKQPELVEAANVPAILRSLHEVGRRGIEVKRFKGLGEMEAVQLWETTMDPARRTLLRVTWNAASQADSLFSILMGEDVEQRRGYIERHALDVKNLDV